MDRLTARLRPARTVRLLLAGMLLAGAVTFLATRPAHAATSYRVVMSGYAFSPRALTITAGSTVTWVNEDQAPHDVKTTSGPEPIHSPMLSKGGTWSHTFTLPGTYGYVCTVHPGMTAELVVKAAAASTPTTQPTTHQHTGSLPAAAQPAQSPAPSTRFSSSPGSSRGSPFSACSWSVPARAPPARATAAHLRRTDAPAAPFTRAGATSTGACAPGGVTSGHRRALGRGGGQRRTRARRHALGTSSARCYTP